MKAALTPAKRFTLTQAIASDQVSPAQIEAHRAAGELSTPCLDASMGRYACANRAQCWEPCGELRHSAEHARAADGLPIVMFEPSTAAVTDKCRHSHTPKHCGHCKAFAEAAAQPAPPALQSAAQAVLDRWNSPKWEWHKNGPTADLMADLYAAIKATS